MSTDATFYYNNNMTVRQYWPKPRDCGDNI